MSRAGHTERRAELGGYALLWALVFLAYRATFSFELVGDAVFLIEQNPLMRSLANLPAMLARDYFWSPAGESIGYWRPLTKASWLLETVFGGGRPAVYHALQVIWLAAGATGVAFLGRTLGLTAREALGAGLLFALHPAAVEPTASVMARSDLVCSAGTVWAVAGWLRWRRDGGTPWLALHLAGAAVAFASKETAVVLVPVLGAWTLLAPRAGAGLRGVVADLAPLTGLAGAYLVLRASLLASSGGFPPLPEPLALFSGGGVFLRGLLPLTFATGVRNVSLGEAASVRMLVQAALAWGAIAAAALWCLKRGWSEGLVLLAWLVLGFSIVLAGGPMRVPGAQGKIALADRWLFASLAPAALFLAGFLARAATRRVRAFAGVALACWAAAVVIAGPDLHAPYRDGLSLLELEDAWYAATPEAHRTPEDRCRNEERALVRAVRMGDVEAARGHHSFLSGAPGCGDGVNADLSLLSLLLVRGATQEALSIAEKVAAPGRLRGRFRSRGLLLAALAFLDADRPEAAVALLKRALRETPGDASLERALAGASANAARRRAAGERRK